MEIECDFLSYDDKPEVKEYISECLELAKENYGLAGPEFIYQILQNHADRLRTLTRQLDAWVAKYKFASNERYISYPLALAMKCGRWACEFGLVDFDMDALEKWAINVFVPHNRISTEQNRVHHDEALRSFLLEKQNNTLSVISHTRPNSIQESPKGVKDNYIVNCPNNQNIYIRKEVGDDKIYIATHTLMDWCKQRGLSMQVLIKQLSEVNINASVAKQNLGSGISWLDLPLTTCFVFKLSDIGVDI